MTNSKYSELVFHCFFYHYFLSTVPHKEFRFCFLVYGIVLTITAVGANAFNRKILYPFLIFSALF